MALSTEALISLFGVLVNLPPMILIVFKIWISKKRRSRLASEAFNPCHAIQRGLTAADRGVGAKQRKRLSPKPRVDRAHHSARRRNLGRV